MTTHDMIMSSNGSLTFTYRVGAIAVHNERLLVEHDAEHRFCFVPGGRVEYGENDQLAQALIIGWEVLQHDPGRHRLRRVPATIAAPLLIMLGVPRIQPAAMSLVDQRLGRHIQVDRHVLLH